MEEERSGWRWLAEEEWEGEDASESESEESVGERDGGWVAEESILGSCNVLQ